MAVLRVFGHVLRKQKNKSGSISIEIFSKERGKYKVAQTVVNSNNEQEIRNWHFLLNRKIERLNAQSKLFISESDTIVTNMGGSKELPILAFSI